MRKSDEQRRKARESRQRRRASAFSTWIASQVRGHPDADAALRMLPPRTYQRERAVNPVCDGFGYPVHAAMSVRDERLIELLRMLGRVYVADMRSIFFALYDRRFDIRTTYRDLNLLADQRLIWTAKAGDEWLSMPDGGYPQKTARVYGLSRAGKQHLANLGVEDDEILARMRARDVRGRAPNPNQLMHDLQISWWCLSMIEGLRLIPWCTGIYCQVEYDMIKGQRSDAIMVARFDFDCPRPDLSDTPWIADTPLRPNEIELRWALEVDNSTEAVKVLVEKFTTYRDLHATGDYHRVLNGDVMLVLIAQNARRAAYLAAEFKHVWPGGWGVVSTPGLLGANSSPYGPLWGTYRSMAVQKVVPLLSHIQRDEHEHVSGFTPVMTYELWLRYLEQMKQGHLPTSLYDLMPGDDDAT